MLHNAVMGYGKQMAGATAASAVVGGVAGLRYAYQQHEWADAIRAEDARRLAAGQALPPIPEPPNPKPRSDKGIVRCYATGILLSGVVVWLITLVLLIVVVTTVHTGRHTGAVEKVGSAQFFAFIAGLAGFVIPGILVGAWLWIREVRARNRHAGEGFRHGVWEQREAMRAALANGQITVTDAITELTGEPQPLPTADPVPAVALPAAGEPVEPRMIMAVAAAVAAGSYIRAELGRNSTPATVRRILTDPNAPERQSLTITQHHVEEADDAFAWVMRAYDEHDPYRKRVGDAAVRPTLAPDRDGEAIGLVASAIGGYRRAKANGEAI